MTKAIQVKRKRRSSAKRTAPASASTRRAKPAPSKRKPKRLALSRELLYFDGAFNGCW